MIYDINVSNGDRTLLINFIKTQKSKKKFTVVDVGGSTGCWSAPYVDAIVDFNPMQNTNLNIKLFKCDITNPNDYSEIYDYIEANGKFDFCICSHTLEDIINPVFVCEQIAKISKSGYVAFPTKYRELSRNIEFTNLNFRGYMHHRWIFTIKDNIVVGFPKINYIESTDIFDYVATKEDDMQDLSFWWEDKIDIMYINNNYLGPSGTAIVSYYNLLCDPSYI
jgi:hypothetical protein